MRASPSASELRQVQRSGGCADDERHRYGKYDLDDAATGRHRVWPAILDAFRKQGFRKLYLRIGWEQNGTDPSWNDIVV